MNTKNIPFASHEVRWFFEGATDLHPQLRSWFETSAPVRREGGFGPPVWMERLDSQPDVYLLLPGADGAESEIESALRKWKDVRMF